MCKGTLEEFYCHLGVIGEAVCPWRDPLTGHTAPYLRQWRQTAWECCGEHVSDCCDCPLLTGDNITTIVVPALNCDECEARVDPSGDNSREARLMYLTYLDNRRRIAIPRFQREIAEGRTQLTMEELLWGIDGDRPVDETVNVARACAEAQLEEEEAAAAKEKEDKEKAEKEKEEERKEKERKVKEEDDKLWSEFTTLNDEDGEDGKDGEGNGDN